MEMFLKDWWQESMEASALSEIICTRLARQGVNRLIALEISERDQNKKVRCRLNYAYDSRGIDKVLLRVARCSLVQYTKLGKTTPNGHKIYQMAVTTTN
jgi:hypothetical protein